MPLGLALLIDFDSRHAEGGSFSLWYGRLGLGCGAVADVFALRAPDGVQPIANYWHVGADQEVCRKRPLLRHMGNNGGVKQSSGVVQLCDWLPEALAQV